MNVSTLEAQMYDLQGDNVPDSRQDMILSTLKSWSAISRNFLRLYGTNRATIITCSGCRMGMI